jgi:hypothetical protein
MDRLDDIEAFLAIVDDGSRRRRPAAHLRPTSSQAGSRWRWPPAAAGAIYRKSVSERAPIRMATVSLSAKISASLGSAVVVIPCLPSLAVPEHPQQLVQQPTDHELGGGELLLAVGAGAQHLGLHQLDKVCSSFDRSPRLALRQRLLDQAADGVRS